MADYYRAPGWLTRNVFNQLVAFLTRMSCKDGAHRGAVLLAGHQQWSVAAAVQISALSRRGVGART